MRTVANVDVPDLAVVVARGTGAAVGAAVTGRQS